MPQKPQPHLALLHELQLLLIGFVLLFDQQCGVTLLHQVNHAVIEGKDTDIDQQKDNGSHQGTP